MVLMSCIASISHPALSCMFELALASEALLGSHTHLLPQHRICCVRCLQGNSALPELAAHALKQMHSNS